MCYRSYTCYYSGAGIIIDTCSEKITRERQITSIIVCLCILFQEPGFENKWEIDADDFAKLKAVLLDLERVIDLISTPTGGTPAQVVQSLPEKGITFSGSYIYGIFAQV